MMAAVAGRQAELLEVQVQEQQNEEVGVCSCFSSLIVLLLLYICLGG